MLEYTEIVKCDNTELTKPAGDYNYQLKFWSIRDYDKWSPDSQDRRYAKFEAKGYVGLTFSSVTPLELKKIKKWVKDQNDKTIKLSNSDWFWNSDCDGYQDNNYTIWFLTNEQKESFAKFLETFKERSFNINLNFNRDKIKLIIKKIKNKNKINYWVIEAFWNEKYVFQTTDKETATQVLRLTKELSAPEIMILE